MDDYLKDKIFKAAAKKLDNTLRILWMYGVKFEIDRSLDIDSIKNSEYFEIRFTVPKESEILINGNEACGLTLAKKVKEDLASCYYYMENEKLKFKYKERDERWTFQKSADLIPTVNITSQIMETINDIPVNDRLSAIESILRGRNSEDVVDITCNEDELN